MRSMLLRLGPVLMLVALLQICGGHWLALQSLAWTEMIVAYAHDGALAEAVAKTFDGQHPCALCVSIEQGKKSEQKVPAEVAKVKTVLVFLPADAVLMRSGGLVWDLVPARANGELLFEQPGVPPPRAAVG